MAGRRVGPGALGLCLSRGAPDRGWGTPGPLPVRTRRGAGRAPPPRCFPVVEARAALGRRPRALVRRHLEPRCDVQWECSSVPLSGRFLEARGVQAHQGFSAEGSGARLAEQPLVSFEFVLSVL